MALPLRERHLDLAAVALAAAILAALARVPGGALAAVGAVALPGYPLALAVFPRRGGAAGGIGLLERAGLTLLASLALVPIELAAAQRLGAARPPVIALASSALTLAFAAIAAWRREGVTAREGLVPHVWHGAVHEARARMRGLPRAPLAAVALALVLLAGVAVAVVPTWGPHNEFAELLLLPETGKLTDLPRAAVANSSLQFIVALHSHASREVAFHVSVRTERAAPGTPHDAFSGTVENVSSFDATLSAGGELVRNETVRLPSLGTWRVTVESTSDVWPGTLDAHLWLEVGT